MLVDAQRIQESKRIETKEYEERSAIRERQMLREEDKDRIRELVIRYLSEREYLSLNELVDRINAPRVAVMGRFDVDVCAGCSEGRRAAPEERKICEQIPTSRHVQSWNAWDV